jgi:hypothetical protein
MLFYEKEQNNGQLYKVHFYLPHNLTVEGLTLQENHAERLLKTPFLPLPDIAILLAAAAPWPLHYAAAKLA